MDTVEPPNNNHLIDFCVAFVYCVELGCFHVFYLGGPDKGDFTVEGVSYKGGKEGEGISL